MAQLDTEFRSLIECALRLVPPTIFSEMAVPSAERRERAMRQIADIIGMNLANLRRPD